LQIKVAGCDCGKNTLSVCVLNEPPTDLKALSRRYRPIKIEATRTGLDELLSLNADLYVLEPTGNYSRLWVESLKQAGKTVKLVNPSRVKFLMRMNGITNKSDRIDAVAIAAYGMLNQHSETAFLSLQQMEIKELLLDRDKLIRSAVRASNQIGNRLTHECPELVTNWEGSTKGWGELPKGVKLTVAGIATTTQEDRYANKRQAIISNSIGSGLSQFTTDLGQQLHSLETRAAQIETEISAQLRSPKFERYREIFQRFQFYEYLEAVLLTQVYPFEKFLGDDGRRIVEYVPTKRDRSEGAFKLSIGMGKVLYQSGGVEHWKAGGSKLCRTALWQFTKIVIVMGRYPRGSDRNLYQTLATGLGVRQKQWLNQDLIAATAEATGSSREVAKLRLHFEFTTDKKGDRKVSATAGLLSRMLYKSMLQEFQASR